MPQLYVFLRLNLNLIKMKYLKLFLLVITCFFVSVVLQAQPSGGPYGPIQQNYELPKVSGTIYYVSPDADANSSGASLENPTSIESAFKMVKTGDAIILRGGVYRTGDLKLNQGITMQPFANEKPILKGSKVADNWKDLRNGLWQTSWENLFPGKPASWWRTEREGPITPLHKFNNDMVFVDGKYLHSAAWMGDVDENSFYIDYNAKKIYIGTDPSEKLVEITAFEYGIERVTNAANDKTADKIGPIIKGITLTHYAFQGIAVDGTYANGVMQENDLGKEVVGTTLEHCEISFCGRVGAWLLGDKLTMRHCKVSDTSTEGVYINCGSDILLEKNIFTRNNIEQITGYYPAAVKIFNQTHRVVCNDNLVIDLPHSHGIWYDVGNIDGVFANNWVQNVGLQNRAYNPKNIWPAQSGFFFEISKGAVCVGNVFVDCDLGTLVLNSCDVKVYNNTFINSPACFARDQRSAQGDHFGWHPQTGPDVEKRTGHAFINNLCFADKFEFPMLMVWQPDFMCERLKDPAMQKLNNNVYVNNTSMPDAVINQKNSKNCRIAAQNVQEINETFSSYAGESVSYRIYQGWLFKGIQTGNYQLMKDFSGNSVAAEIPDNILKLRGNKNAKPYVGAWPVTQ